jgi:hypothetical protein
VTKRRPGSCRAFCQSPATRRSLRERKPSRELNRAGVPYHFVDWDAYPEARSQLGWLAGGRIASPTVTIGGQVLVQPSLRELDWALTRVGYH